MNANTTRSTSEFLRRHSDKPASFSVHLHQDHWLLNNAKFLYSNQCSSILEDIRSFRIPVDFIDIFDAAKVPYYDGRLIVELFDHRLPARAKSQAPPSDKPEKVEKPEPQRVILHPNDETIWADLLMLNSKTGNKYTDHEIIRIEAAYVNAIGPPLCLDPDPNLARIVNTIIRTTSPGIPPSLKRKQSSDMEEDETDRLKRSKLMQFMNTRYGQSHHVQASHLDKYFGDNKLKYRSSKANEAVPTHTSEGTVDLKAQGASLAKEQTQPEPHPPQQPPLQQQQQNGTPINRVQMNMSPAHGMAPVYGAPPPITQKPTLNVIAQREELKPAIAKTSRKRAEGETPSPVSATAISKTMAKGKGLLANGRSATPHDSQPNSPATTVPAPSGAQQGQSEDVKPQQPLASNQAPQQAHQQQVLPGQAMPPTQGQQFQPPLPPRTFLQQPPPSRRKTSDVQPHQPVQLPQQPHGPMQQQQPNLGHQPPLPGHAHVPQTQPITQQHQGQQQAGQPPTQLNHAIPAALYQDPRYQHLRMGVAQANSPTPNVHLAQSIPARGSPLATATPVQRPSPHLTHLVPQQGVQQRGSPLANSQPVANRSPAPSTAGGVPGQQEAQPPQTPSTQTQNVPPNVHAAANYNALLAQYGLQNAVNLAAGRGIPQLPASQLHRQGMTPQQQQQMLQNMPYPPLNLGQMQQLAFNNAWRQNNGANQAAAAAAAAHLGRGAPSNMQQYVQNAQNAAVSQQMIGRGMSGTKRVPGR